MNNNRRKLIQTSGALLGLSTIGFPALGQARSKVKVGYLHTPAVDGQIWTGDRIGSFASNALEMEFIEFTTGLELFQAMVGGSLDMLSTGAVVSNFPARGQGKVFLINNVEFATAQLWVREDMGIKTFADLKGKKISTTTGTTAHVFLDNALRANNIDASSVEIVNQRMAEAVTSFISGAVPAVALWVPFDITVRNKVPGAKKLVDASAYYPQAAITGGWAARSDYYEKNKEICRRVIKGWALANDALVSDPSAVQALQEAKYKNVPLADFKEQFKASKYFSSTEWTKLYADGTAAKWLQQVTDFFIKAGGIQNAVPATTYFDSKLYLETIKA